MEMWAYSQRFVRDLAVFLSAIDLEQQFDTDWVLAEFLGCNALGSMTLEPLSM